MTCKAFTDGVISTFFSVETPRVVKIYNVLAGVIRAFLVVIYITIAFAAFHQSQDFQEKLDVIPAVHVDVDGVLYNQDNPDEIWDIPDYLVQKEVSALAIATKETKAEQTLGTCNEPSAACVNDTDCPKRTVLPHGHGPFTGVCNETGLCEIKAWCPVMDPHAEPSAILEGLSKLTITVQNWIGFVKWQGFVRNNFNNVGGRNYDLSTCYYDRNNDHNKLCPRFKFGSILKELELNETSLIKQGGIIGILIEWDCDLDFGNIKHCKPVYSFRHLDKDQGKGWTIRKDIQKNAAERTLMKTTGVRVIFRVSGIGRKFDWGTLMVTLGSMLGIMGSIHALCVFIVIPALSGMCIDNGCDHYKQMKTYVPPPDEVEPRVI